MHADKFMDLPQAQQKEQVTIRFQFREGAGWFTLEGVFVGRSVEDVIAALIDLEEAEINTIGDCMTGCCMVPPRLEDFVRKL
jgi:hypothetical protein